VGRRKRGTRSQLGGVVIAMNVPLSTYTQEGTSPQLLDAEQDPCCVPDAEPTPAPSSTPPAKHRQEDWLLRQMPVPPLTVPQEEWVRQMGAFPPICSSSLASTVLLFLLFLLSHQRWALWSQHHHPFHFSSKNPPCQSQHQHHAEGMLLLHLPHEHQQTRTCSGTPPLVQLKQQPSCQRLQLQVQRTPPFGDRHFQQQEQKQEQELPATVRKNGESWR
jgi:hypothetical protein